MTKFLTEYRRDWKAIVLGYDDIIVSPVDSSECEYCLTVPQVEALLAIVEPLAWQTRWFSEADNNIVTDTIEAFRDDIRRRLMMPCCGNDRLLRINADGTVQASYDGGATWVDSPQDDPRSFVPVAPPIPGDDGDAKRCAAANSATAYFKQQQQAVLAAKEANATMSDIAAIIVGFLLILGIIASGGLFALLGAALAVIATNLNATDFAAAFTDDTWAKLACIIYCRSDNAGTITRDAWALILSDIPTKIGSTAGDWLVAAISQVGYIGLQNAAHLGLANSPEIDCTDCVCGACLLDHWSPYSPAHGTVTIYDATTLEITGALIEGFGYYGIIVTPNDDDCCYVVATSTVSGTVTGGDFCNRCGTAVNLATPEATILNKCVRMIEYVSTVPFVVHVQLGDCP